MRNLVFAVLAVCAIARAAHAHQTSVKYLDVIDDGGDISVSFRFAPGDVTEPMQMKPDARPGVTDAAGDPRVAPFVARWLAITSHGAPCPDSAPTAQPDEDGKLVVVAWTARCAAADELAIDLRGFFAIDQRHVAMVHVEAPNTDPIDTVVHASEPALVLHIEASALAWVRAGFERTLSPAGTAFLLALLVASVIARAGATWRVRGIRPAVRHAWISLAAAAAAYAVALLAGGLGWIALPPRLLAIGAALTVFYLAADNALAPEARRRPVLAFSFGLVHGLGLAAAVPHDPSAIASFSLGAVLGFAVAGLVWLPVVLAFARLLGAARYRRYAIPVLSAVLCGVAVLGR